MDLREIHRLKELSPIGYKNHGLAAVAMNPRLSLTQILLLPTTQLPIRMTILKEPLKVVPRD